MISVSRAFRRWRLASKIRDAEASVAELEAFARALPAQTESAYARLAALRANYYEADTGIRTFRPEYLREPTTRAPVALVRLWTETARGKVKTRCAERRLAQAFELLEHGTRREFLDVARIGPPTPAPFQRPRVVKAEP